GRRPLGGGIGADAPDPEEGSSVDDDGSGGVPPLLQRRAGVLGASRDAGGRGVCGAPALTPPAANTTSRSSARRRGPTVRRIRSTRSLPAAFVNSPARRLFLYMRVGRPASPNRPGRDARAYQRRHTPGNRLHRRVLLRRGGVDGFPVALHVDHRPLPGKRLIERLVEAPEGR